MYIIRLVVIAMMKNFSGIKVIEDAEKTMSEIKQNKSNLNLSLQVEKLAEHVNNIMELKKIATPRSSIVINDLLVLTEQIQSSSTRNTQEEDVNTTAVKTSYQNENENDQKESWQILKDTHVLFSDIQGCNEAILDISESVIIPLKYPRIFRRSKSRRSTGILLYGPPGTGKSMIARATAGEISATFFTASCAELTSRWVGGSEKKLKSLFDTSIENAPSIVFLDEIDSIAGIRSSESTIADQRLTNQLLIELDNISNQQLAVFVIAATNLPWQIDDAVMRRLSRKIYIPMPDLSARRLMFMHGFPDVLTITQEHIDSFAQQSENLSGSDISTLISRVKVMPLHLLYRSKKFFVSQSDHQTLSVSMFMDGDNETPVHATFDDMVQKYGEDSIAIPDISSAFILSEISSFTPTVSFASREMYKDYVQKNK